MKNLLILITCFMILMSCKKSKKTISENPFLNEYTTEFGIPPFDKIKLNHYLPALEEGIKQQNKQIEKIISSKKNPNFENTILALDRSSEMIDKIARVFFPLNSATTTDEMQDLSKKIEPLYAEHRDNILLNKKLFQRIKNVYQNRNSSNLDKQQIRVIEKYFKDFTRNGANLSEDEQEKLRELNQKLTKLTIKFGENLLAETNKNFKLIINNKKDLRGLPKNVIEAAKEKGDEENKWVFTLQKPSMIPFLQYAKNRKLREKIYKGYFMRGDNENEFDNKDVIKKIVELRDEKAKLLGFKDYASYIIDKNMAKNTTNVYNFLNKLWNPALKSAQNERKEMQRIIYNEGGRFKLKSWDWWYYAEKLRKKKYNLDEEELKPYFSLDNCIKGVFYVCKKLYGITFSKLENVPSYHKEASAYEVKESDGSHLGILFMDFHPRDGKRVGAWCTSFREATYEDNKRIPAIATIVMNFTRPTSSTPALLSFDEVTTFFHEFGHALHVLFTDGPYKRTAGDVERDFVEFPSQVMENWATTPEVLRVYAKHYETEKTIPDVLINKIKKSSKFNQGFATVEYLAASLLDMDYHTTELGKVEDVRKFENNAMNKINLISEIIPRYRSTYFQHIFRGGYAAGYYVYIWSEVLAADAYHAFEKTGNIFDPTLAKRYRQMLAKSGDGDGMEIYKMFSKKDPDIKYLLRSRGLN